MERMPPPPPPPPPPGMQMPRGPGMMPQQRQQQFQQGPPPHFQQQRQPHPIIHDDRRNPINQPINPLARVNDITFPKVKTEKDYRKEFTTYEAYVVAPTKDEKESKEKKDKKSSEKGKGTTWTKARVIKHPLSSDVIATTVKKLDAKESVTKKISELGANQSTQVSDVLGEKLLQDRDLQFEWTIAQLDKSYNFDKKGKKSTKSIVVYLKRSPKPDVDCEALHHRLLVHRQQQAQDEQHHRMMQQQQQQMNIQRAQQEHAERMNPPRVMGPGGAGGQGARQQLGPPAGVRVVGAGGRGRGGSPAGVRVGGGRGSSPAGVRIVEMSDSDSKSSNSNSDTNSESDSDSETDPSSISSSRSGRRRKDKQYYGRGNARSGRSRSRNRNKDYTLVSSRRRLSLPRRYPAVPESPRERSRPTMYRNSTYGGHPTVEVRGGQAPNFFDVRRQHSPLMQSRPILHQSRRDSVHATGIDGEGLADMMAKVLEVGLKAGRQETADNGALTLTRPPFQRSQTMPRPPILHPSISDVLDQRTRRTEAQAEAIQELDELEMARLRRAASRARDSRSPHREPRDMDPLMPRRFGAADFRDPRERYPSATMSPSIISGSSSSSYSSRGRNPYAADVRDSYGYRRRGLSPMDSDRDEYDFVTDFEGRDDRNPFQPRPRARTPSRPAFGRANSMRSPPYLSYH